MAALDSGPERVLLTFASSLYTGLLSLLRLGLAGCEGHGFAALVCASIACA